MHPRLNAKPTNDISARAIFRAPVDDDFIVLAGIRRDRDIQALLLTVPEATDDDAVRAWIERRQRDTDGTFQVIADASSGKPLGFVQISQVHRRNLTGYGGLALVDHVRGQGFGRAALEFLTDFAARQLGLSKLLLEVRLDNDAALKLYLSGGFRIVGTLARHFRDAEDKPHDVLLLERLFTGAAP